jgi:predicted dehydrogenase
MNPIGVGFLDLNAEGLFHLERMLLRTDFRCVAGWSERPERFSTHGFLQYTALSPQEIIEDAEISLLWIGPQAQPSLVRSALDAGKHVLLGLPTASSSREWQSWTNHSTAASAAQVFVAALHRWDGQFQTVQQLVQQGELGQLIDVRRISRQYVPQELSLPPLGAGNAARQTAVTLPKPQHELQYERTKWFEILDELSLLVDEPVISVSAQSTGTRRNADSSERSGCCVSLEFASGCRAWLELNRLSLAPLETGWILDGHVAGFAEGKRFRAGADYELIDVPVEESVTDQSAFYNSVAAAIQNGGECPVSYGSIQHVLKLIESIEASIQTGQAVRPN